MHPRWSDFQWFPIVCSDLRWFPTPFGTPATAFGTPLEQPATAFRTPLERSRSWHRFFEFPHTPNVPKPYKKLSKSIAQSSPKRLRNLHLQKLGNIIENHPKNNAQNQCRNLYSTSEIEVLWKRWMCKKPWFLVCRTHFAEVFPIQKAIRNERKKRTKIMLEKGAPPAMENMKIHPAFHIKSKSK